jgi:peptide/nickel transport system permease protein
LGQACLTLIVVSIVVFLLLRVFPGSPIDYYISINPFATEEFIEKMEQRMGLDKPLWRQYLTWLSQVARGDFGDSLSRPGQSVGGLLRTRVFNSLLLSITANAISFIVGVPIGILTAIKRHSIIDGMARVGSLLAYSVPSFCLGLLLIYIFSVYLRVFPSSGMRSIARIYTNSFGEILDVLRHMVLPAITLGSIGAAFTARLTRSSMLEVVNEDYVRTARAKGLKESRVVWKHMLKNALCPVITVMGLQIGFLFGSAAVTETVFAWPGVGREVVMAAFQRDYPVIIAITIIIALVFICVNLVTDITYVFLDPRVRL